ncbi:hypothetical protein VTJ83DRAFT_6691 [Remersonia thermophila]|uniref:Uncharacterized protein n=1 Tax=Remersonia thermophila TaxID=72144 RepID=A0ABR4D5E8_9PEZI
MTVAGPLTTAFEAPSSCSSDAAQIHQVWSGSASSYVAGPLFARDSHCFPSGYGPEPTRYFSPGWCPRGYTTACSSVATAGRETETAVLCCPAYYTLTCPTAGRSDAPSLACTSTWTNALAVLAVTVVRDGTTQATPTAVSETAGGITAYGIQVRFQSGDPTPPPTPTATSASRTDGPASHFPPGYLIPTPTAPPPSSGGVSTSVAIGIGVGSAVAALLLAGAIGLCFFLRRRRKTPSHPEPASPAGSDSPPPVPPKEPAASPVPYRSAAPRYELSENTSPPRVGSPPLSSSLSSSMSKRPVSKRPMSTSPVPGWTPASTAGRRYSARKDSQVLGGRFWGSEADPAELEAPRSPRPPPPPPPSSLSLSSRERTHRCASPGSESTSAWSDRGARGATMPSPWL